MYHLSTYFSVEIIYISIVYTTVPLTFKVFNIFYLPIGLPHSVGLNINHGLHPSLLTCSFCVLNLNTCTIHSNTSAWNLSHPWSFPCHPEGAWHRRDWGEWWWWFEFNFVYPSVPLISSLNTHYHSFCSYSDHLT